MAPANKNLASWETRVTNFEYFLSLTGLKTTKINCIFLVRIMINSLLPSLWTLFSVSSGIYCTAMSQNSTRKKIEVYLMWGSMADHADLFNRNVTDCVHSGKNSIYFFFTFILAITINSCHASSWITLLFFLINCCTLYVLQHGKRVLNENLASFIFPASCAAMSFTDNGVFYVIGLPHTEQIRW